MSWMHRVQLAAAQFFAEYSHVTVQQPITVPAKPHLCHDIIAENRIARAGDISNLAGKGN